MGETELHLKQHFRTWRRGTSLALLDRKISNGLSQIL